MIRIHWPADTRRTPSSTQLRNWLKRFQSISNLMSIAPERLLYCRLVAHITMFLTKSWPSWELMGQPLFVYGEIQPTVNILSTLSWVTNAIFGKLANWWITFQLRNQIKWWFQFITKQAIHSQSWPRRRLPKFSFHKKRNDNWNGESVQALTYQVGPKLPRKSIQGAQLPQTGEDNWGALHSFRLSR